MKWIGMCLSLLMLTLSGVHAAPEDPKPPFEISTRHGYITEYYPGRDKSGKRVPVVVFIQDLHANVGVQKNIASILYRLKKINRTPELLVCVEGASGMGDVSLLRSLPGPIRRSFEGFLLRKAYLTGAELAATEAKAEWEQTHHVWWYRFKSWFVKPDQIGPVSLSPIKLWGIDDPDLYRKNWRAAKIVDKNRFAVLNEMRNTKEFLLPGANAEMRKHLDLLTKLLMLRLQPQEYVDYLKTRQFNPKGSALFQEVLKNAEIYYEAAEERSDAMTKNLLARMGRIPGYTAVITGGFHTGHMTEDLRAMGISYAVITPDVKVLDQDDAYRSRLREEE